MFDRSLNIFQNGMYYNMQYCQSSFSQYIFKSIKTSQEVKYLTIYLQASETYYHYQLGSFLFTVLM